MNIIKKITFLFLFIIFILSCKKEKEESIPSECTIPLAEDAYEYPIVPGDPEWAELQTGREMDSVLLLPDSILTTISTDGLVETCLNYPLFGDVLWDNTGQMQSPFIKLTKRFNGYQELFRRELAGENLLQRYKQMKATCIDNNYPTCDKGWIEITFAGIEMLLAQDTILKQLDKTQLTELNNEALIKFEDKLTIPQKHTAFSKSMTALIIGRILRKEEYPPFIDVLNNDNEIKSFIDHIPLIFNPEILDTIVNYGNSFSSSPK